MVASVIFRARGATSTTSGNATAQATTQAGSHRCMNPDDKPVLMAVITPDISKDMSPDM
jgi:hypothetical protein